MNYKNYSSEGFVIGRRKFGEADRILTLFTKDFGKITVIAKGVRKLTSRKRGGIEIFSQIKFSAVATNGFDILTEVEVLDTATNFTTNLRKMSLAFYFCEVVAKVTREEEKHTDIYQLLQKYFKELEDVTKLRELRLIFVEELLVEVGFWPAGKKLINPDAVLESVTERKINSTRVGKKMLQ